MLLPPGSDECRQHFQVEHFPDIIWTGTTLGLDRSGTGEIRTKERIQSSPIRCRLGQDRVFPSQDNPSRGTAAPTRRRHSGSGPPVGGVTDPCLQSGGGPTPPARPSSMDGTTNAPDKVQGPVDVLQPHREKAKDVTLCRSL